MEELENFLRAYKAKLERERLELLTLSANVSAKVQLVQLRVNETLNFTMPFSRLLSVCTFKLVKSELNPGVAPTFPRCP